MSFMAQKSFDNSIEAQRPKRGRPSGRNRVPLSLDERRARNAQYERERRNETADALAQLAEALGQDPNISNADLLATAITQIQRAASDDHSLEDLKRINENLESQIAILSSRLGLDAASLELLDDESDDVNELRLQGGFEMQSSLCCGYESTTSRTNKRKVPAHITPLPKRARISTPQFHLQAQTQYQAHDNLQSQLYRQSYPSHDEAPWCNETNTPYCIGNVNQSAITIPVTSTQQILEVKIEPTLDQPLVSRIHTEPACLDTQNLEEIKPDVASILNALTESEKEMITNLINENLVHSNGTVTEATTPRTYKVKD